MTIVVEQRGSIRVATLDRPEAANSLDGPTLAALGEILGDVDADPDTTVMVLTGAGERVFCAGQDLKAVAAGDEPDRTSTARYVDFLRDGIATPVIAAVNGAAVAGGFELVLACDLVVAADHARFGLPEVKRGLIPAGGGTLLPQRIPLAVALELGLTGDTIDATRAHALGLVNHVVPGPDVLNTALALAEAIAANGPVAVRTVKQLMHAANTMSARDAFASALDQAPAVFASADASEGAQAFAEKRAPRWRGV